MAYSDIDKPSDYFNTLLWTGNGGTQSVTGVGFAPDFVWIKRRNALAGHKVNDTVRGVNKQLTTNNTNAEGTDTNQLTAFGSDGFTLGNNADVNASGGTFVGWNWLAVAQLHQTQMEVLHQAYQLIQQVDLVLCLILEMVLLVQL
jgi:hypothetical protein